MTIKTALLAILAATATAHAAPTWCGKTNPHHGPSLQEALGDDAGDALTAIYELECFPGYEGKEHAGEIEAARKAWSQRLGMTDADWSDVADWAESDLGSRRGLRIAPKPGQHRRAWSTLSPLDQFVAISEHQIETHNSIDFLDPAYLADALGPKLTEAGRLAYIHECLSEESPVAWAMCAPDTAALDPVKLGGELRGDAAHPGFDKMVVRITMENVRGTVAARHAQIKELVAQDKAYKEMFAIAKTQRGLWTARWRDRADLLALAAAMDDAIVTDSRKAREGCDVKVDTALRDAIGKLPATAFDLPHASEQDRDAELASRIAGVIVADPDGYLAANAYAVCRDDAIAQTLGANLGWPGYRGPRTATATAILAGGVELDRRDAKIVGPEVRRPWLRGARPVNLAEAVVESVKTSGATATIAFTRKPEQVLEGTGCSRTNRISQITNDGRIIYEEHCTGTRTKTITRGFSPVTIPASYAPPVKRGAFVAVGKEIVWAVWPKATATVPRTILGVAVK